ncbi:MAG: hypothetical protein GY832_34845 [Chloroflexi bacterium]|nr:hypothetical protein [Chloroflexota bacterium]
MIPNHRSQISDFRIYLLGLALVIAGYLGPWIPHKTAALTVTGLELAEFAKFFPQVQGGIVAINRVLFYLPLVSAFVFLALFASRSMARLVRWIVLLAIAALLSVTLLPYPVVDSARHALSTRSAFAVDPQYVGHLTLIIVGTALVLLTPLARRLSQRVQSILVVVLALVGAVPGLWQFATLRPLAATLYDQPLGLGWGLIACVVGFVLLVLSAVSTSASPKLSTHE